MAENKPNKKINIHEVDIDKKYDNVDDITHALMRPGMVLGNIHNEFKDINLYKPSTGKMVLVKNVPYNAGFMKLFDEIIANAVDVYLDKKAIFPVTQIDVNIDTKNNEITVRDNGGIVIKRHTKTGLLLPHMIFGLLRSSGNYNEERSGAGLNGYGAKLTNIYSTEFNVTTADTHKIYYGKWKNNMRDYDDEVVENPDGLHFTEIKWKPDFSRFEEIDTIDISNIRLIQKRCIDAAASNPGLQVNFTCDFKDGILNSEWNFADFKNYVLLHTNNDNYKDLIDYHTERDAVVLLPSIGYNFGFVNGSVCSEGSHMRKVQNQLNKHILRVLKSLNIELITTRDIENHTSIFVKTNIINPDYDSQAKDKLTSKIPAHSLNLPKTFLDKINKDSEIIKILVDYYNVKYLAEKRKKVRKLNKQLATTKTKKLIKCSGRNPLMNEFFLFEGDSAKSGFRQAADSTYQAAYMLRGKIKNTLSKSEEEVMNNQELREIIAALGIRFNEPKKNLKNCKFGKIIIGTDADVDGSHIAGLLLVFFMTFFPELIEDGRVYRILSPIIIAEKGKQEKLYYTLSDYEKEKDSLKGWEITYNKGLGGLQTHHYNDMIRNKKLEQFYFEGDYLKTMKIWFDKSTEMRKEIIAIENGYTTNDE